MLVASADGASKVIERRSVCARCTRVVSHGCVKAMNAQRLLFRIASSSEEQTG